MADFRTLAPFQQFALNASGTGVGLQGHYPSNGIVPSAGLGALESTPMAYGALALGAAGLGAATVLLSQQGGGKPLVKGALATCGMTTAVITGFGSGLSTAERTAFGALSMVCLGAYYFARR